jgi:drug/metabolite transporter (DMT)-like permease
MPNKSFFYGPLLIILAAFLWSLDGFFRTDLRYSLPAINIVFWEHFLGFLIISPIFIFQFKDIKKLQFRDWLIFALIGLFPSVIATLLYTAALGQIFYAPLSIVVLLQQLQPIWALLSAKILLKEKLPPKFLLLAVIAMIGAYLITFRDLKINLATGDYTFYAGIFGLLAGAFWGLGTTLGRMQVTTVSSLLVTGFRFAFGTIFALVLMFLLPLLKPFLTIIPISLSSDLTSFNLDFNQFQTLILIVFVVGLTPMIIYYFGLKNTQAKIATICELTWPASVFFIDMFYNFQTKVWGFRGDIYSFTQIIGICLLLTAIYLVSLSQKSKLENNG